MARWLACSKLGPGVLCCLWDLTLQRKKQAATFKPIDYVVVRGKKVLSNSSTTNTVLEWTNNIVDPHQYRKKTKSFEE